MTAHSLEYVNRILKLLIGGVIHKFYPDSYHKFQLNTE